MTLYELIRRLLHWEAEQTSPPSHVVSAVQETMRQQSRQKKNGNTTQLEDE